MWQDFSGACADRAEEHGRDRMQEDCLWNAFRILTGLAKVSGACRRHGLLAPGARAGPFLDDIKTRFGSQFLKKVMEDGTPDADNATRIIRDIGFDPASIPRLRPRSEVAVRRDERRERHHDRFRRHRFPSDLPLRDPGRTEPLSDWITFRTMLSGSRRRDRNPSASRLPSKTQAIVIWKGRGRDRTPTRKTPASMPTE